MNSTPSITNAATVVAQLKRTAFPGFEEGQSIRGSYGEENLSISLTCTIPPDLKSLPTDLQDLFTVGTICLEATSVPTSNNKQWISKKADWQIFAEAVDNGIPLTDGVDLNWCCLKEMILRAEKKYIPRGKLKNRKPYLSSKSPLLQPLLDERKIIFENRDTGRSNYVRIELNKINAKIKRLYAQIKRDKWNDLCSGLDSRTSNGKLWKLLKNISNEQPQAEKCNTILSEDGNLAVNDEQAADLLGLHYQKISRLNFSIEDRNIKIRASRIVHGCRGDTHRGTSIPSPDGIYGQMIDHLGLSGRQRFFGHYQLFLNKGQLPSGLRTATVIPIKNVAKLMAILEYGIPVYCSASVTNSETRNDPGQHCSDHHWPKNTCPRDIVLFRGGLRQPLSLRRRACLTKYYNKLRSLILEIVLQRTSMIGVITRDSGETVPTAKWSF
ncbi:uncharacterized protein TNCV_4389811 [Trichonephila clavipes]|nr:uncharacterized protein TNCV_4389811 [Trichonephila clavipes]